ncbi:Replication factor C large subunit [Rhynchospora pubera]|uniref:Replication factor C large subunit n=1 Tax=Rhynchospora pubera TaxID=906938 RepID=A0AAV8HW70_9POAL|nr:Replication factor C large subunit [Rhynchospora pubera]
MEEAVDLALTPSPPEATRRRSVQTKLCFGIPKSSGENGKGFGEIEAVKAAESPKKRRGRPKKSEASAKTPVIDKEGMELKSTNDVEVAEEAKVETKEKPKGRRRVKSESSDKTSPSPKRGRSGSDTPSKDDVVILEDSPGKRQRRGVKVVPCRKRCKALESISEEVDGPSLDSHKEVTIDPRSEARMAAEENSRLSVGKQVHPFFASRMPNKRSAEISPDYVKLVDKSSISCQEKDPLCPPIHVHDSPKCDVVLDWGRWTLKEASCLDKGHLPPETSCSVFEAPPKPLTIKSDLSKETCLNGFAVGTIPNIQLSSELVLVDDGCSNILPSNSSIPVAVLIKEDDIKVSNGSCQRDSSLWTDKYHPENASQVCGNSESVSFLSEWLKSWHERGRKSKKIPNITEDISEESCSSWYMSESDMDDLLEECDLWNVLLITGPVGSGKSAAVYACAKEQGFHIVEVNASDLRNGAHIKQKFGEATESHGIDKWSRDEILVSTNPDNTESNVNKQVAVNKTLVLFEDVDTVFEEDSGFISTIRQLADTTKWPIVLTSNNKKPVLPRQLSRLVLEFSRPSSEELLLNVQKICALEKAGIPVSLMKHAIDYCLCDIRRITLLLQFWCQDRRQRLRTEGTYGPIPLDTDAMHSAVPIAFPYDFPCELSEKICTEINQTISSIEEQILLKELQDIRYLSPIKPSPSKPKKLNKKSKLKRNQSIPEFSELEPCSSDLNDFSDVPNTPVPTVKQNSRNKRAMVMSDSEDETCTARGVLDDTILPQPFTPLERVLIDNAMDPFECNGAATPSHVCDTFISVIPESPYTSKEETVSMNGNTSNFNWAFVDANGDAPYYQHIETHGSAVAVAATGNFCAAMDECSSAGFYFKGSSSEPVRSVEDTWNRLRNRHEELKGCMRNDSKMASRVLKSSHQVVDLISETDILVTGCSSSIYDMLDRSLELSEEPDALSSYDVLLEIGSVYARHGLGIYMGSWVDSEKRADLGHVMLASSSNSDAIGRLLTSNTASLENLQRHLASNKLSSSHAKRRQQQQELSLYEAVLPIIPPKLAISLKGPSFHEYISSTSQISKLEFSRLSQNEISVLSRRSRQSRHYLTTGKLQLTPEEAELLARCNSFDVK